MDVDPVVREKVSLINDQTDGKKVTVFQFFRSLQNCWRCRWLEFLNKLRDGHTGDKVRPSDGFLVSVAPNHHALDAPAVPVDPNNAAIQPDLSAAFFDCLLDAVPHHARPTARIIKLIDQC